MAAEGWGKKKFVLRGRSTVKNKERVGIEMKITPLPAPSPIYSDFKSNMAKSNVASRMNEREIKTLARMVCSI